MSTPFSRAQEERDQLNDRITKLGNFLMSPASDRQLTPNSIALLKAQLNIMNAYAAILEARIAQWEQY